MSISHLNHKIMKMFGEYVDSNIPTKALVSDSFKIKSATRILPTWKEMYADTFQIQLLSTIMFYRYT